MPRGGPPTYTYTLPAVYLAVPGTTILATQHNSPLEDIAGVLNGAWPTNLGGTGGTSLITSWDSLNSRGDAIPTAATLDLDAATGANAHLTGTTTVTSISLSNGRVRELVSDGTFLITASASIVVNGNTSGSYQVAAGSVVLVIGGSAGVVYVSTAGGTGTLFGYATTATAAGTTTLVASSAYQQYFTGSTTQTVVLPVTSTLTLGQTWCIVNTSTGAVTVQSSGANTIVVLAAGTWAYLTCISLSGTSAASWDYRYSATSVASGKKLTASNSLTFTGTDGDSFAFPSGSDTVVARTATQTLTNKTINGPDNTLTNISLTASVTGTLPVANGGTGLATITANNVLLGNGTSAMQVVAPGTSGNVLTSNGTTWTSTAPVTGSMTLLGTLTTTSGTTQSLTGIAGGYYQFYIELDGVSANGTDILQMKLGSGSTSYGAAASLTGSIAASVVSSGFIVVGNVSSTIAAAKGAQANVMKDGVVTTLVNIATPTGTAAVATAVQFLWSGGAAFDAGAIRIYGVK